MSRTKGHEESTSTKQVACKLELTDGQFKVVTAIAAIRYQDLTSFIKDAVLIRCQAEIDGLFHDSNEVYNDMMIKLGRQDLVCVNKN